MRLAAISFFLGAIVAFAIAFGVHKKAEPVNRARADSLRVAIATAADLEAAVARSVDRARADSIALAISNRRIRLVVDTTIMPADTVFGVDTALVFKVPPEVARHVEKLNSRIASMQVVVDTLTLSAIAERHAKEIAIRAKEDSERALADEKAKRWGYRAQGVGVGAILISGLAAIFGR